MSARPANLSDRDAKRAELLLLQLSFLLGEENDLLGTSLGKNRLVSDTPSLRVKVGLLYFTNGAIRMLLPPKK